MKIQYPRLASQVQTDFTTLKVLATVVGKLFKNWEYTWLFPELEESVHLELDFLQEATNGERVGRLFERDRRIHIPRVRWDLSSSRVLTMEYIDGVKVTDVNTLKGKGIDPRAVGETISNLFSLMVFSLGLTHCDPHPGKSEGRGVLLSSDLFSFCCVFLYFTCCSYFNPHSLPPSLLLSHRQPPHPPSSPTLLRPQEVLLARAGVSGAPA